MQLERAGAHLLGVADQDGGVVGQHLDEQFEPVDEGRGEGLHAVDGVAVGDAGEQFAHLVGDALPGRVVGGPLAHLVGEQHLAAGVGGDRLDRLVVGALVGNREGADLLDRVAEEVDAHRVFAGGWEDVDDAAAHRELAATLDEVDAHVGRVDQGDRQFVDVAVLAGGDGDRQQVTEAGDLGLQDRAHGRDDDPRRGQF